MAHDDSSSQDKILKALIEAGVSEAEAWKIINLLTEESLAVEESSSLSPEEVKRVLLRAGFDNSAVQALCEAMAEKRLSPAAQSVIKILARILGWKMGILSGSPVVGIFSGEIAERFFEYIVKDFQKGGALSEFLFFSGVGVGYLLAFPIVGPIALAYILYTGGEPGEGNTLDSYEQFMP